MRMRRWRLPSQVQQLAGVPKPEGFCYPVLLQIPDLLPCASVLLPVSPQQSILTPSKVLADLLTLHCWPVFSSLTCPTPSHHRTSRPTTGLPVRHLDEPLSDCRTGTGLELDCLLVTLEISTHQQQDSSIPYQEGVITAALLA